MELEGKKIAVTLESAEVWILLPERWRVYSAFICHYRPIRM